MKIKRIKNVNFGEKSPKICIPIVENNIESILDQAIIINKTKADCIEWRCDYFEGNESILNVLQHINRLINKPLIFTFRTQEEGGQKKISQFDYEKMLVEVSCSNLVDIIDVEYQKSNDEFLQQLNSKVSILLSYHNFKNTPDGLEKYFEEMDQKKCDFVKIAVMPQNDSDVEKLVKATQWASNHCRANIISMSMGELGKRSRLSNNTCITFASLSKTSAPGQMPLNEVVEYLQEK